MKAKFHRMARYNFNQQFEKYFIDVCNASLSMSQASITLGINYKTLCFHAKILDCFKSNQSGKGLTKTQKENVISIK